MTLVHADETVVKARSRRLDEPRGVVGQSGTTIRTGLVETLERVVVAGRVSLRGDKRTPSCGQVATPSLRWKDCS